MNFAKLRAEVRANPERAARVEAYKVALTRRLLGPLHRVAHFTRHNYGHVETFWHEDTLMVGFRCNCGQLLDVAPCRRIWPE